MSRKATTIEIKSPDVFIPNRSKNLVGVNSKETFYSNGHQCSYCKGSGYFWCDDEQGESYKKECPACEGSGKLNAVITVEWKASKII